MSSLIDQALAREWFYAYELPDGRRTPTYHGVDIQAIHDTRWRMARACLGQRLGDDYAGLSALDLASHQGWFAIRMAQAGFGRVLGIDARASHVEDSSLMAQIYGLDNLAFRQGDIHALDAAEIGAFDVVLMLGLLYHLENPIGALRACRALCRNLCLIETQIVPGMSGFVDYGGYQYVRPLKGSFGTDAQGKDIFMLFTGSDWCIWCKRLDAATLADGTPGEERARLLVETRQLTEERLTLTRDVERLERELRTREDQLSDHRAQMMTRL